MDGFDKLTRKVSLMDGLVKYKVDGDIDVIYAGSEILLVRMWLKWWWHKHSIAFVGFQLERIDWS